MPIPKPNHGENHDKFMARCMADISGEYEDKSQAAAICMAGWKDSMKMSRSLDVEIFSAGIWNGFKVSEGDLHVITAAFHSLKDQHKVPLKFGHNDDQPMLDGLFALGWVEDLWVAPGHDGAQKLFARLIDMPDVVHRAIKRKMYRKVSIELDLGVTAAGKKFSMVLSGVALLGADLPAVTNLADLDHYLREPVFSAESRKAFTYSEDLNMNEIEELKKKLADIESANKLLAESNAKFKQDEVARVAAEEKSRVSAARGLVNKALNDAVSEMKITPAMGAHFSKLLRVDDDVAVVSLKIDDINAMIAEVSPQKREGQAAFSKASADGSPDDALTVKAHQIRNTNPGMQFSAALIQAMKEMPDQAKAYVRDTVKE